MGGEPRTELNIACFPQKGVPFEIMTDILRGGLAKAEEAGVVVVGGHTVIDEEIKFGMAVTRLVPPDPLPRHLGGRPRGAPLLPQAPGPGGLATAPQRGGGGPAHHPP